MLGQWAGLLTGIRHGVHTITVCISQGDMRPGRRGLYVWRERLQMAPAYVILSQNAEDVDTVRRDRIADPAKLRYLGNGIDILRFAQTNATAERRTPVRAELEISTSDPLHRIGTFERGSARA